MNAKIALLICLFVAVSGCAQQVSPKEELLSQLQQEQSLDELTQEQIEIIDELFEKSSQEELTEVENQILEQVISIGLSAPELNPE